MACDDVQGKSERDAVKDIVAQVDLAESVALSVG
jgi:hypothetical protein